MSLDVSLSAVRETRVFEYNITHNLGEMADAAGIYKHLWRPDELGITVAQQLIEPLTEGLFRLRSDPVKYKSFNPENGWGNYDDLVAFVTEYLQACVNNPDGIIRACR